MGYYKGYFRSLNNDTLYSVNIKTNGIFKEREITLAGSQPFVVTYNESTTIYEPIKTSIATIRIISNSYMEDIIPSRARETSVSLINEDNGEVVWFGYITPKIYNQPYEKEYEEIEFEAADVVSSLQYLDFYHEGNRGFATFKELIINAFKNTGIDGFYWPATKLKDDVIIYPDDLKISERNFFSDDTDEPWNFQEVIEEMCKYMGLQCIQYKNKIYFMDYAALSGNNNRFQFIYYSKNTNWAQGNRIYSGQKRTITQDNIMGNGQQISFEPIYNKIKVKDNFYTCEEYITNLFDDSALTNRAGTDFYSSFQLDAPPKHPTGGHTMPNKPTYPWGSSWFSQKYVGDGDGDNNYYFWHRLYDHKDFESVYRNDSLQEVTPNTLNGVDTTKLYVGATICDLGRVRKDYMNDAWQMVVENKIDWERYLLISQRGKGWGWNGSRNDNMVVFRTKPNSTGQVLLDAENSYLIIYYKILYEKYQWRNYINPTWENKTAKAGFWQNSTQVESSSALAFRLGIGGKYWNGSKWTDSSASTFTISHTRQGEEEFAVFNSEREVLNNVSWELNIEEEGYKIPMAGVDTGGEFVFEIFLPKIQLVTDYDSITPTTLYNQYCWVKDFKMTTATVGQDKEVEESDIVYENVIDESSIYELSDIDLKFTTAQPNTKPSFSNVVFWDGTKNTLFKTFDENVLPDKGVSPEENIIQRYYQQYSTPTKKLSYTLDMNNSPFDKYYGMDVENPTTGYIQNGLEIDYSRDTQIMTLVEKK